MARSLTLHMHPVLGRMLPITNWDVKGSATRTHKRVFAALIVAHSTGLPLGRILPCMHCGEAFDWIAEGECDRTVGGARGGIYTAGRVAMICSACNLTRGNVLQQADTDLPGVNRYVADIVTMTNAYLDAHGWITATEAKAVHAALSAQPATHTGRKGGGAWLSRLARSPYWNV